MAPYPKRKRGGGPSDDYAKANTYVADSVLNKDAAASAATTYGKDIGAADLDADKYDADMASANSAANNYDTDMNNAALDTNKAIDNDIKGDMAGGRKRSFKGGRKSRKSRKSRKKRKTRSRR